MADEVTGKGQAGGLPSRYPDQFSAFRTELDRLFDSFLTGIPILSNLRQSFPAAQGLTPAWDVKETEKELLIKADLPGIDEKDIHLTINDGVLKSAWRKEDRTQGRARELPSHGAELRVLPALDPASRHRRSGQGGSTVRQGRADYNAAEAARDGEGAEEDRDQSPVVAARCNCSAGPTIAR